MPQPVHLVLIRAYEPNQDVDKERPTLETKLCADELGWEPAIDDVITTYQRWGGSKRRIQVVRCEIDIDVGIMELSCVILDPLPAKTIKIRTSIDDEPRKRRGRPPKAETTKLAPFLSTDGSGREKMTTDNLKANTRPNGNGRGEPDGKEEGA